MTEFGYVRGHVRDRGFELSLIGYIHGGKI